MSSDISRQRFNPTNDFQNVLMQQGRVQLDADWNEWNEILDRRWRSETIDIIGRCVVPLETPDGFEIQLSGGSADDRARPDLRPWLAGGEPRRGGLGVRRHSGRVARRSSRCPTMSSLICRIPTPFPKTGGPHLVYHRCLGTGGDRRRRPGAARSRARRSRHDDAFADRLAGARSAECGRRGDLRHARRAD